MNICMITREFPPFSGGVGSYVYNLSGKLAKKGHNVSVITAQARNQIETINGVRILKAPYFGLYPFNAFLHGIFVNRILKLLENQFEIVHFHTPLPLEIKTSLPLLTTVHTPMKVDAKYHEVNNLYSLAERLQVSLIYPPIEAKLFKTSNKITAVSKAVAEELREYGLSPRNITVIGNGVDENIFYPTREKLNTENYVLYTGILRAEKDYLI